MVRALYGMRLREPYMPEFGFSSRLGSQFLGQNGWSEGNGVGAELRFTLAAIREGTRIGQVFSRRKGSHRAPRRRPRPGTSANRGCVVLRLGDGLSHMEYGDWFEPGSHHRERTGTAAGSDPGQSETTARDVRHRRCRLGVRLSVDSFPFHSGRSAAALPGWMKKNFITLQNCG